MKIYQNVILALLIAFAAAFPASIAALAIDEPYWHVATNAWPNVDVPPETPEDDSTTLQMQGEAEHYVSASATFGAVYDCDTVDCGVMDIYILLEVSVTWDTDYPIPPAEDQYFWYEWGSLGLESDNHEEVDCGTTGATSGTCSMSVEIHLTPDEVSSIYYYEFGKEVEANVWLIWNLQGVMALPVDELHTTINLIVSSEPIVVENTDCSGQFLLGAQIASFTLSSQFQSGVNLQTAAGMNYPAQGEWFAIRVTAGWWQNQGIGLNLRDLALKHGDGIWFPIDTHPTTGCDDEDSYTWYVQVPASMQAYYLRVGDVDADFISNTGTLTVAMYSIASYTPFYSGCELNYDIGEFIETKTVAGDYSNGLPIDQSGKKWNPRGGSGDYIIPFRYYMIETFGGPVSLGDGSFTFDADMAQLESMTDYDPEEWHNIWTAPFVECVTQIDQVGHVRAYFVTDEQIGLYDFIRYWFAFRVRDTGDYSDNAGSLSYRLYEASNRQIIVPGTVPEVDGCLRYSHAATATSTTVIQANDEGGSRLGEGTLEPGLYAFQVEAGPWQDNSVDSYSVEISNDDGDTWYDLEDYPYLLCSQSADGDHYLIYAHAVDGQVWRARVGDSTGNYANNTLTINMVVYTGITSIDPFPTCEDNYTLTYIGQYTIPGTLDGGQSILEIVPGGIYSIMVTDDNKWYDDGAGDGSYLLQISDDGGDTWENMEEYADLCTEQIENYGLFQIFFTSTDGPYKLRVQDDADWLGNTGSVVIKLYSGIDTGNPVPHPWDDLPPQWVVACDEVQDRPDSVIEWYGIVPVPRVAAWLDYIRYAITYFFAWCPEHTEALESIGEVYTEKEPLASILALRDFVESIQQSIDAITTLGGEEDGLESQEPDLFGDLDTIGDVEGGANIPEETYTNPLDLFVVGNVSTEDNPWFGGELHFDAEPTDLSGLASYRGICESKFYPLFGITTVAFCYTMGAIRYTKIVTWALLAIDLVIVIWWVIKYFPGWLRRLWDVVSGGKGTIESIAGRG